MIDENRRHGIKVLAIIFSLSFVFLLWHGCGGGGGGSDSGTTPTKSVVIKGTVPGTIAVAYRADGTEVARVTANGLPASFFLSMFPGDYYLMFVEFENTPNQISLAFQNVTGGNVFHFLPNTVLDLGNILMDAATKTATPDHNPLVGTTVTESVVPPADFGGLYAVTGTVTSGSCDLLGTIKTSDATITQNGNSVSMTILSAGETGAGETYTGVANVNSIIVSEYFQFEGTFAASARLEALKLADGSLAGTFTKVGFGGECSGGLTISAVRK